MRCVDVVGDERDLDVRRLSVALRAADTALEVLLAKGADANASFVEPVSSCA